MLRDGRHILRAACAAVAIAGGAIQAFAYNDVVVFGDSLSDVGNVYGASFGLVPASPPYYQGHFSNGPIWVEEMAAKQGLPAVVRSRNGGNNYAYGGVETGQGSTTYLVFFNFPNLGTQINSYLGNHTPSADDLFVVWGGANDFNDGQTDPTVPARNMASHIIALAQAGAKDFIVPNLPPMGETPRYRGTASESSMNSLSSQYNALLAPALSYLETNYNINIYQLDIAGAFNQILTHPGDYGITNTTDPALVGSTVVANPDQYLFWDDLHPTRVAHGLLGDFASDLLDTHGWASTAPTGTWSVSSNWYHAGAPQSRWIVNLVNDGTLGSRQALVNANSSVRKISISGASQTMSLGIDPGVTLSASESVTVLTNGQINFSNGTLSTPALNVAGGRLRGSGVVSGNLTLDPASSIQTVLSGAAPSQHDKLQITGSAALDGTIDISTAGGFIPLPGTSYDVLTFGSHTGVMSILNDTGFAGLSFLSDYTATALTLTATATPGDADLNGMVDLRDLYALASHWKSSGDWLAGDFNGSGTVNAADLGLLASHWQSGVGSLALAESALGLPHISVPEPSSACVVVSMLAVVAFRRRRHLIG
jgi:phospholipase/lecithinase/hemolysin